MSIRFDASADIMCRMCGRYGLATQKSDLAARFDAIVLHDVAARYNIAPSQPVLIARADRSQADRRVVHHVQWGLIPSWADDPAIGSRMINARGETAATRPAFRSAMKHRRCLVPASGFYEWRKGSKPRQPFWIHMDGGETFAFGGLYEHWTGPNGEQVDSCTILTTTPNELIEPVHDRMPMIVAPDDYARWLDSDVQDAEEVEDLIRPYPSEGMDAYPVGLAVNSPAVDDPSLIEPAEAQGGLF